MTLREMEAAISEAEATLSKADIVTNQLARLLIGRLRKVTGYGVLKSIKAELRDFNAVTQQWKEKP